MLHRMLRRAIVAGLALGPCESGPSGRWLQAQPTSVPSLAPSVPCNCAPLLALSYSSPNNTNNTVVWPSTPEAFTQGVPLAANSSSILYLGPAGPPSVCATALQDPRNYPVFGLSAFFADGRVDAGDTLSIIPALTAFYTAVPFNPQSGALVVPGRTTLAALLQATDGLLYNNTLGRSAVDGRRRVGITVFASSGGCPSAPLYTYVDVVRWDRPSPVASASAAVSAQPVPAISSTAMPSVLGGAPPASSDGTRAGPGQWGWDPATGIGVANACAVAFAVALVALPGGAQR